jgi:4-amino-4-deoxy-L-arabinose transferase-like glycosyltransferase
MILFSFIPVFAFTLFTCACLRITSRSAYILSVYILAIANIILTGLTASFVNLLNNQVYFLAVEFLLASVSMVWWLRSEKPAIFGPWQTRADLFPHDWWKNSWKKWAVVWILGILILFVYLLSAWLVWNVPSNTNDSLLNHLARVGYWLQHGNLLIWPTPSYHNIVYPVNANLLILWTILFTRNDLLAGFVQWTAALASATAVFGLARLLGWGRPQSLFAGFLWLTLPEILMQSTTTQQDLIVSTLFIITVYFFILGIKQKSIQVIILSSLTLGLTIGTKQVAIFALPGLALFILIIWLKDRKNNSKLIITWILASMVSVFLLGSYIYFQNSIFFGNPIGNEQSIAAEINGRSEGTFANKLTFNTARLFYQGIDFTGLPPFMTDNLIKIKSKILKPVFSSLSMNLESTVAVHRLSALFNYLDNPPIQEDTSWYGLLGFFLLVPLSIIHFIRGIRQRDPFRVGLVILAFLFFMSVIALRPGWEPFEGRYLIISIGLICPFAADILRKGLGWKILDGLVVALAAVTMFNVTLSNVNKPLISYPRLQEMIRPLFAGSSDREIERVNSLIRYTFPNSHDIWDLNRTERQLLQNGSMVGPVNLVQQHVPENASLALGFANYLPAFPFFGEHLSRKLYPVYPPEMLQDEQWFRDNHIDFLLLHLNDKLMRNPPSWLIPYQRNGEWELYYPEWVKYERKNP